MNVEFEPRGLGYAATWHSPEDTTVELGLSRIKRERIGLSAHLRVTTGGPGMPLGLIHQARVNMSTHTTRTTLAKYLSGRTNGVAVPWGEIIEATFSRALDADSVGAPIETVDASVAPTSLPYLINGFARRGVVTWLFGPGGSGKTTLLTALAMSIATHRELVPGLSPAFKGTVLYLDWETDRGDFSHRAAKIAAAAGLDGVGSVLYRRCERPVAEEAEELAQAVGEREVVAVFMDSAGLAIGHGNEGMEAAEPTLRFFRACRVMRTTVIVGDHVTKSARGKAGATPYGSIYKENLARASWELRKVGQSDTEARMGLHLRKANDRPPNAAIGFRVDYREDGISFAGDVTPTDVSEDSISDRVMAYLSEGGDGANLDLLTTMLERPQASIRRTLFRLKKAGRVDHLDGRWFVVTEDGVTDSVTSGVTE